jgi:hypothetical protein
MRNVYRGFVLCLLFAAGCAVSYAQHQRLGLSPQSIRLNDQGASNPVEAFCLDQHVYASTDYVPYANILNEAPAAFAVMRDGTKVPLARAMEQGRVTVQGAGDGSTASGLALKFVSHDGSIREILIEDSTAFGESAGGSISKGSPELKELRTNAPRETSSEKADRVWRSLAPERILQELGFYPSGPVNPTNTQTATRSFQAANGLAVTGSIDSPTSAKLTDVNDALIVRLKRIGFSQKSESKVPAVSDPLRQFESYHHMPETGRLSARVLERVARDEAVADQMDGLVQKSGTVSQILDLNGFSDVLTFYRADDGVHALVNADSRSDYWISYGGEIERGRESGVLSHLQFGHDFDDFVGRMEDEGDGVVVSTGRLGDKDLSLLENTKSARHPDTITVVVSPFQQGRPIPDYPIRAPSATRVARALRHHFGSDTNIFIAQDLRLGLKNAAQMPKLSGPQEIRFFVDGRRIDDRGIVKSLTDRMESIDIDVVEAQNASPAEPGVGIVVGKNDENMRSVLSELAGQGAFRNGILAIAKCGNTDDVEFNSRLIQESGAKAIIFYDEKIQPQAVKRVLVSLVKRLTSAGVEDGDWTKVFRLSVKDAAVGVTGSDLVEILKLRNAHIQTSELITPLVLPPGADSNS